MNHLQNERAAPMALGSALETNHTCNLKCTGNGESAQGAGDGDPALFNADSPDGATSFDQSPGETCNEMPNPIVVGSAKTSDGLAGVPSASSVAVAESKCLEDTVARMPTEELDRRLESRTLARSLRRAHD